MKTENTPQTSTEEITPPTVESQEKLESLENLGNLEDLENQENQENLESQEGLENLESLISQDSPLEEEIITPLPEGKGSGGEALLPERTEDISEDDYQAATTLVSALEKEITAGTISSETLALLLKSVAYDRAVATAHHEGEVAGRNQRIDEYLQERRKEKDLPDLGRSPVQSRPTLPYTIIGGLTAADRKSIWERGNEKRHRR